MDSVSVVASKISEAYCNSEIARNTTSAVAGGLAATALVTNPAGIAGAVSAVVVADAVGRTVTNVINHACGGPVKETASDGIKIAAQTAANLAGALTTHNAPAVAGAIESAVTSVIVESTLKEVCTDKEKPQKPDSDKKSTFYLEDSGNDCGIKPNRPKSSSRFSSTNDRPPHRFNDPTNPDGIDFYTKGRFNQPSATRFQTTKEQDGPYCGNSVRQDLPPASSYTTSFLAKGEENPCATTTRNPHTSYPTDNFRLNPSFPSRFPSINFG